MGFESRAIDPQRLLPQSLEDRILVASARAVGVVLCTVTAVGWISLLTWSVADPSLTHATGGTTSNLLGPGGAVLSDLLLQTLGIGSVFVLLPPAIWGVELIMARHVPDFRAKLCLFPLAILLLAGACLLLELLAGPVYRLQWASLKVALGTMRWSATLAAVLFALALLLALFAGRRPLLGMSFSEFSTFVARSGNLRCAARPRAPARDHGRRPVSGGGSSCVEDRTRRFPLFFRCST